MKWTNLMKYCIGMVIGLAGCAYPIGRPAWYSYGGIIAPAMPREYPYAVMTCADPSLYDGRNCTLYLFSGPPAVEDGSFKAWETDLNVIIYRARGNVWKKENEFTLALGDSTAAQYGNFVWSNVDLYELDSELLLSASDPLPATDYATTLFEGDVTTAVEDYIITAPNGQQYTYTLNGAHAVIADSAILESYGLVRITVDDVPVGYKIQGLLLGDYAGNRWLTDAEQKDTGGNAGVLSFGLSGETLFLTRDPGTYHVKVEKIERRAQIAQQWETLFEGEVTTVESDTYNGSSCQISTDTSELLFNANDSIRITINGESQDYTAVATDDWGTGARFGNTWLYSGKNSTAEDVGGDYLVYTSMGAFSLGTQLYTRTPGTYTVKIERAISE